MCVYTPDEVYPAVGKSHSRYIPVIPLSRVPQPENTHTHTYIKDTLDTLIFEKHPMGIKWLKAVYVLTDV